VLLPRARGARDVLAEGLAGMGARVDDLPLYVAAVPEQADAETLRALRAGEIDIVTFASSSAVHNLCTMLGDDAPAALAGVLVAAIGPVTAAAAREAGLTVAVEAREHTIEGLVAAIVAQAGVPAKEA
jgi:uroporphyrinogen III methyltransferase/synthase